MKLRILTPTATQERAYDIGDIAEWQDETDAARLVAAGYAEFVESDVKAAVPSKKRGRRTRNTNARD